MAGSRVMDRLTVFRSRVGSCDRNVNVHAAESRARVEGFAVAFDARAIGDRPAFRRRPVVPDCVEGPPYLRNMSLMRENSVGLRRDGELSQALWYSTEPLDLDRAVVIEIAIVIEVGA